MRSARVAPLALAVGVLALAVYAYWQQPSTDPSELFPVGSCVNYTQTDHTRDFDSKPCSAPHQWVIDEVIVQTTGVIAEQQACPSGDRGVEWPDDPYGALVCLRPSE